MKALFFLVLAFMHFYSVYTSIQSAIEYYVIHNQHESLAAFGIIFGLIWGVLSCVWASEAIEECIQS